MEVTDSDSNLLIYCCLIFYGFSFVNRTLFLSLVIVVFVLSRSIKHTAVFVCGQAIDSRRLKRRRWVKKTGVE